MQFPETLTFTSGFPLGVWRCTEIHLLTLLVFWPLAPVNQALEALFFPSVLRLRSVLAGVISANLALKRTCLRQAAYLGR